MATDAEQVAHVIALARETYDELGDDRGVDISDAATVEQEPDGCWVSARVWMANVYIVDDGEG